MPVSGRGDAPLQCCYVNDFATIWEYDQAQRAGAIDWAVVIGPLCPLCRKEKCYRRISPYERGVVELFPHHEGRVEIARFQCRQLLLTFSLLPYQLAPYFIYTIAAVVGVLVLAQQVRQDEDAGVEEATLRLDPDRSRVLPGHVYFWQGRALRGLRRAYAVCGGGDLAHSHDAVLADVQALVGALRSGPDPPCVALGIVALARRYSTKAQRHLLGVPSQERTKASATTA